MQMITNNHLGYINNELMNMDPNTYSHYEIYEWHNNYLDQRFFTDLEYSDLERIEKIKVMGHNSIINPKEDRIDSDVILRFKWEDRYSALNQHTIFFRNLMVFSELFWHSNSIEEYKIKLDLNGLKEEYSNFWIVWLFNVPEYEFAFDWKNETYNENNHCGYLNDYNKYKMLEKMYYEIEYNNKPMVKYKDIIKKKLSK